MSEKRDKIFSNRKRRGEDYEWNGETVFLGAMSALARAEYIQAIKDHENDNPIQALFYPGIVINGVYENSEAREPMLDKSYLPDVEQQDPDTVMEMAEKIMEHSRIGKDAEEEAEKNSSKTKNSK